MTDAQDNQQLFPLLLILVIDFVLLFRCMQLLKWLRVPSSV
jgi:hypothetical protein